MRDIYQHMSDIYQADIGKETCRSNKRNILNIFFNL